MTDPDEKENSDDNRYVRSIHYEAPEIINIIIHIFSFRNNHFRENIINSGILFSLPNVLICFLRLLIRHLYTSLCFLFKTFLNCVA